MALPMDIEELMVSERGGNQGFCLLASHGRRRRWSTSRERRLKLKLPKTWLYADT